MSKATIKKTTKPAPPPPSKAIPRKPEELAKELGELADNIRDEAGWAQKLIRSAEHQLTRARRIADFVLCKHAAACRAGLSIEGVLDALKPQPFDESLVKLLARWKCGQLRQAGATGEQLFESLWSFVFIQRYSLSYGPAWLDSRGEVYSPKHDGREIHFFYDRQTGNFHEMRSERGDIVARPGQPGIVGERGDLVDEVRRVMGIPFPKTPPSIKVGQAKFPPGGHAKAAAKPQAKPKPKPATKAAPKPNPAPAAQPKPPAAQKPATSEARGLFPDEQPAKTLKDKPIPQQPKNQKQSWNQWATTIEGLSGLGIEPAGYPLELYNAGMKPGEANKLLEAAARTLATELEAATKKGKAEKAAVNKAIEANNAINNVETRMKVLAEIDQRTPMDRSYAQNAYGGDVITWLIEAGFLMPLHGGVLEGKLDLTGMADAFLAKVTGRAIEASTAASPAKEDKPAKGKPKSVSLSVRPDGPPAESGPSSAEAGSGGGAGGSEIKEMTLEQLGVIRSANGLPCTAKLADLEAAFKPYAIHPDDPTKPVPADWQPRTSRLFWLLGGDDDVPAVIIRGGVGPGYQDYYFQEIISLTKRQHDAVSYADRRADCSDKAPEDCPLVDVKVKVETGKLIHDYVFGPDSRLWRIRIKTAKKGGGK